MSSVISVLNLSKIYRLGLKEKQSNTLIGQISQAIRSPWDNLKRLRELNRFGTDDDSVFLALKDVSFEVKEGEVLGIIGKNGAGKSTLLKILSQITEPTSGKIEIHGRVASLLEVGTGFHPELTGRENVYMNGTILGMTKREIDSKLDEIIDFSGVEKFIDTPVKFYSSGMKVRLGFSVAAHLDPEILIIDEVLAVGDFEFQKKCLGKMENVAGQGRTVLFVSHNLSAISSLCDSSLLLDNGNVLYRGNSNYVIEKYLKLNSTLGFLKPIGSFIDVLILKNILFNNKVINNEEVYLFRGVDVNVSIFFESKYFGESRTQLTFFKDQIKVFTLFDNKDFAPTYPSFESNFLFNSDLFTEGFYHVAIGIDTPNGDGLWIESVFSFHLIEDYYNLKDKRNFGIINFQNFSKNKRLKWEK